MCVFCVQFLPYLNNSIRVSNHVKCADTPIVLCVWERVFCRTLVESVSCTYFLRKPPFSLYFHIWVIYNPWLKLVRMLGRCLIRVHAFFSQLLTLCSAQFPWSGRKVNFSPYRCLPGVLLFKSRTSPQNWGSADRNPVGITVLGGENMKRVRSAWDPVY